MNTESTNSGTAKKFLTALKSRDWIQLKSILKEDAVWTLPGKSLISGEALGADAIIRRAQTIVNFGVNFELKHILLGRDGAALSLHNTARRGELILDEHLATVMDISDGRITYIKTYL
jgi:uncharacterized protein